MKYLFELQQNKLDPTYNDRFSIESINKQLQYQESIKNTIEADVYYLINGLMHNMELVNKISNNGYELISNLLFALKK